MTMTRTILGYWVVRYKDRILHTFKRDVKEAIQCAIKEFGVSDEETRTLDVLCDCEPSELSFH
jgi:hypothetical protein